MIFISALNTDLVNKSLLPIFLIFFVILMLIPFIGIEIKGAKRWLNFFGLRFQPIEFIKPFFVLIVAQIIALKWIKNMNLSYFILFRLKISTAFSLIFTTSSLLTTTSSSSNS